MLVTGLFGDQMYTERLGIQVDQAETSRRGDRKAGKVGVQLPAGRAERA